MARSSGRSTKKDGPVITRLGLLQTAALVIGRDGGTGVSLPVIAREAIVSLNDTPRFLAPGGIGGRSRALGDPRVMRHQITPRESTHPARLPHEGTVGTMMASDNTMRRDTRRASITHAGSAALLNSGNGFFREAQA